jgi:hypothetical protein
MFKHLLPLACLAGLLLPSSRTRAADVLTLTAEDLATRPPLALVAEMDLVPEVEGWTAVDPNVPPDAAATAAAATLKAEWAKLAPWLTPKLTPAVARALSRWAAPQMEKYATVPPLDKLTFQPVATLKQRGLIVFETKVDRLPVHHQLVTRHLVAYVTYDPETKTIKRVTITIRGHVEE